VKVLRSLRVSIQIFLKFFEFLVNIRFRKRKNFWKFLQIYEALIEKKYVDHLSDEFTMIELIDAIKAKSNLAYWNSEHESYLTLRKSIYRGEVGDGKANPRTVIVGKEITSSLGHLGHFADRCKAVILGLDTQQYVITGERFANKWLVEQYLNLHVPVIKLTQSTNLLLEIERNRDLDQICLGYINGRAMQFAKAHNQIEIAWKNKFGERPLFLLSSQDDDHLAEYLKGKGLSDTCWYVTLHLRDAGYENFRNSGDFENYVEAVGKIISEGGWVFRIGSQETPPFPFKHERFIDYANNGDRTDRLDICLLAKCRFHFGTSSGVSEIPPLFGRSVLRINASRLGSNWVKWNSIEVPRILVRRKDDETVESFREQISLGWLDVDHEPTFRPDLYLRNVSSDEILAGVVEMLNGDYEKDSTEQRLIESILTSHGIHPSTTVSRYFAEKHSKHFS
jgi:putative glycosyltransferase (TIGR04372 family)